MSAETNLAPLVQRLRAWRLNGLAAALLEEAGPLTVLGAQALHFAAPAVGLFTPPDGAAALALALETPEGVAALRRALSDEA
jgi:hypothetical protein